ncbi:uncharacterized protein LOC122525389 [Polistes fuscatus]|uniref:uncharacterized protein LOC122525389 n=1 Tax=Polistes fuscatus TaxID=30207 RepID=UPI001CA9C39C|nr:uncharacterized protein LOC122525389 [Polistes fuscatus]
MRMADESTKKSDVGATTINSTFKCKSCKVIIANEELYKMHEPLCIISQEKCGGARTRSGTETVPGSGDVGIAIGVLESGSGGCGDSIGGDSGGECGIDEEFPENVEVIVPSVAYRCPYCKTSYAKRGNLKRHIKIGCGRDPNYFRNKK